MASEEVAAELHPMLLSSLAASFYLIIGMWTLSWCSCCSSVILAINTENDCFILLYLRIFYI